jgi:hypothetical protein
MKHTQVLEFLLIVFTIDLTSVKACPSTSSIIATTQENLETKYLISTPSSE